MPKILQFFLIRGKHLYLWYNHYKWGDYMKVGFISLGCSKNLVDSEKMMGMLLSGNHEIVNDPSQADAIIINTCGFIESAKMEAINTIFEMAEYKEYGLKKLIVTGCLAQRYKESLIEEMPEVDRFIKISEYKDLNKILEEELGESLISYGKSERLLSSKPWTAYLKIAEGCSNRCTYCAIPLIRGGNVSRTMEDILEEAKVLEAKGIKELVLIAQDTTKYGEDLYGKLALLDLLKELNKMEGFHWIRILYMYPDEITDALIEGMATLDKVVPYFDIPMQHANNHMLKLMNRRGSKEEILKTVKKIRDTFKHPTLRTTFIVGFPHETEAEFNELMDFVKEVKWNSMGAFAYSREEDTPAYDMGDQIEEEVKEARVDLVMSTQKEISLANNKALIGEVLEVLVEGKDSLRNIYRGRSVFNAPDDVDGMVMFTSERNIPMGSFVNVKITDAYPYDLKGVEVID